MPGKAPIVFSIENEAEFRRAVRKLGADARKRVKEVDKSVATMIGQAAEPLAPELTGALRRSIKAGADQKGGTVKAGTAARVKYAPMQHWGWKAHGIHPSLFILRAIANVAAMKGGEISQYYLEEIKKAIGDFEG